MYKSKIDVLKQKVKNNEIKSCSLIGKPTKELYEFVYKFADLTVLFDKYKIHYKEDVFGTTSVGVYFDKCNEDMCMISIENPNEKQLELIINNLFETVVECIQKRVPPAFFTKIIGTSPSELTFSNMLLLIPEKSQADICEKIGRSPQALSDIKSGKNNLTVEVLSKLMNLYPLLPWEQFIKDITK